MKAITVKDPAEGLSGLRLEERPEPYSSLNDVTVQVYASGFTHDELSWPPTWVDRRGQDRTPSIPGHEVAGIVSGIGEGATGFTIGQRVFGLTDWYRDGSLAEYVSVQTRNLAPLPADIEFNDGAALVMSGLTAWQGLFVHGQLQAGQRVLIQGASGIVGSMAVQLAREAGAYVIGTGRASGRQAALDFGAHDYLDLEKDRVQDAGTVDLAFEVFGGEVAHKSAAIVREGGKLVTIAGATDARPKGGSTIDFIVEAHPGQLTAIAQKFREGRLRTHIGTVVSPQQAIASLSAPKKVSGKTIIRFHE